MHCPFLNDGKLFKRQRTSRCTVSKTSSCTKLRAPQTFHMDNKKCLYFYQFVLDLWEEFLQKLLWKHGVSWCFGLETRCNFLFFYVLRFFGRKTSFMVIHVWQNANFQATAKLSNAIFCVYGVFWRPITSFSHGAATVILVDFSFFPDPPSPPPTFLISSNWARRRGSFCAKYSEICGFPAAVPAAEGSRNFSKSVCAPC